MTPEEKGHVAIVSATSTRLLSKKSFDTIELSKYDPISQEHTDEDDYSTKGADRADSEQPDASEDHIQLCKALHARRTLSTCQVFTALAGFTVMLFIALSALPYAPETMDSLAVSQYHTRLLDAPKISHRTSTRSYTWVLAPIFSEAFNRTVFCANGQLPGPSIQARVNDTIRVTIQNHLDLATTIHWHGLALRRSNQQDGVPSVTQRAVLPGESLTYEFRLDRRGTYWWHAHVGTSRLEGLYGAIIVHGTESDLSTPIHESLSDLVVFVGDWYKRGSGLYTEDYLNSSNVFLTEPQPDAIMINGHLSSLEVSYQLFRLPRELKASRFWRLRVINVGAIAEIRLASPAKAGCMTVFEADSTLIKPVDVQTMNIAVGQRYSVLIDTDDYLPEEAVTLNVSLDTSSHSHHHHKQIHHEHDSKSASVAGPAFNDEIHHGFLTPSISHGYKMENGMVSPTLKHYGSQSHLHTGQLHPSLEPIDDSGSRRPPRPLIILTLGSSRIDNTTRSTINDVSYVATKYPLFERLAEMSRIYNTTGLSRKYSPDILTLSIRQNEEILILFNNTSGGNHPMHIHGHQMQLLATNTHFYNPLDPAHRPSRPFSMEAVRSISNDGIERDTINVEKWALVKLKGGGRGLWSMHCHAIWHEISGMMMLLEVR